MKDDTAERLKRNLEIVSAITAEIVEATLRNLEARGIGEKDVDRTEVIRLTWEIYQYCVLARELRERVERLENAITRLEAAVQSICAYLNLKEIWDGERLMYRCFSKKNEDVGYIY